MKRFSFFRRGWVLVAVLLIILCGLLPNTRADVKVTADVVYGHKYGMALTLDVFQPEQANGVGVLFMLSGGWYSKWLPPEQTMTMFEPLLDAGFTVFAVRHGSSPKFVIPEIVPDVRKSVRFVRLHAKEYQVDPERLGVCGASAGGHLSLMLGTTSDDGIKNPYDELSEISDRVAAVVAFYPPTDLREIVTPDGLYVKNFPALGFDPNEADDMSPLLQVTSDDAPALMVHGDKDMLVPLWHSEKMCEALRAKGVDSELLVIEGAGHGFSGKGREEANKAWVEWFKKHLLADKPPAGKK